MSRGVAPSSVKKVPPPGGVGRRPALVRLAPHALLVLVCLICVIACYWTVSAGTWRLFVHQGFDTFYDAQARSLLQGRWDVPQDAILGEAFIVDGKYYGYFGFAPALPRMVLNALFPSYYGKWTRFLMLLCAISMIPAAAAMMRVFDSGISPFLLLVAVTGSTVLFLCSLALVYHEAPMMGATFAVWAYLLFAWYMRQPSLGLLAGGCALSFLAFFSRLSVGAGPMICAALLLAALLASQAPVSSLRQFAERLGFAGRAAPFSHAALLGLFLTASAALYLGINHVKFGTWIDPAPLRYNVQYSGERMERIGGRLNHLSNIPFNSKAYFSPDSLALTGVFPWIALTGQNPGPGTMAKVDLVEPYASIPAAMPALAFLSLFGIARAARTSGRGRPDALPLLAAALAAGCLTLTMGFVTYRYVHDFYPFLLIAAVVGNGAVGAIPLLRLRAAVKVLVAVAGCWSIAANSAFVLASQHDSRLSGPDARRASRRVQASLEALNPFGSSNPISYTVGDPVYPGRDGQLLRVQDPPATYRYEYGRWRFQSGTPLHLFDLTVRFPADQPGTQAPLWFAGPEGECDAVYITYLDRTKIVFRTDHWGHGGNVGPLVEIDPAKDYHLRIHADRLNSQMTVELDGTAVLDVPMEFHKWLESGVRLGTSLAPAAHGAPFKGSITRRK